jgi:2-keto-4-pentenoate hydratase/2-oxohepta-3-ene-1,7-dioic acid hydratase in catechol pathway
MKIGRAFKEDACLEYFFVGSDNKHYLVPADKEFENFDPLNNLYLDKLRALISAGTNFKELSKDAVLAPPIEATGITCIGMNYREHAEECGADWNAFTAPTIFGRSLTSLNSPNGHVVIPKPYSFRGKALGDGITKFDYEAELGVVIGKACYNVTPEEALDYVAGYMVAGDYSERARQLQNGSAQWHAGKCMPTSFTTGPYFVTKDEVSDPQNLTLKLWVNGELRQEDSTSGMIFTIAECISALSQTDLLPAGFIISTGTPKGVITKAKPEQIVHPWLKAGDTVKTTIFNDTVDLGTQVQTCVDEDKTWVDFYRSGAKYRGLEFHTKS